MFANYNNGNLVDRVALDMPLLNDLSPSESTEIFDNVTSDDSNNNNYNPCASYHFDIKSSKNNVITTNNQNQPRALNNNLDFDGQIHVDESLHNSDVNVVSVHDDLSEFLVFPKKSALENDPQLRGGCFVELERLKIPQNENQTLLDDQRITRSKQNLVNSVNAVLSKEVKTKKEPNASQTKSVVNSKTLCVTTSVPVEEQPRILLHLVRKKLSNEYEIVHQIHSNDRFHTKQKLSKEYVERTKSEIQPKNNSAIKANSTIKNSCVDRPPKSKYHIKKSSTIKKHKATNIDSAIKTIKNSCVDRSKSQFRPKNNSTIKNHTATNIDSAIKNCCVVIGPLPPFNSVSISFQRKSEHLTH